MASDRPSAYSEESASMPGVRERDKSRAPYINILSQVPDVSEDESPLRLFVSGTRTIQDRSLSSNLKRFDIGFTGTRFGMSDFQKQQVQTILSQIKHNYPDCEWWGHHGDCEGADAEFHELLIRAGFKTHGHPPSNPRLWARCKFDVADKPQIYRIRNHNIVRAARIVIATPRLPEYEGNQKFSGTWATTRYARQRKKPYVVIMPNGERKGGNGWKRVLNSGSQS